MYGPDLSGALVLIGTVLAVPFILGVVATLLAGLQGAVAGPELSTSRRLVGTMVGGLVGCTTLTVLSIAAYLVIRSLGQWFVAIFAASGLGLLSAYNTARVISNRMNRYRCRGCRARFHSPYPAVRCPRCEREREGIETGQWLEKLPERLRGLIGRGPAGSA
jgi:hypothetical protein